MMSLEAQLHQAVQRIVQLENGIELLLKEMDNQRILTSFFERESRMTDAGLSSRAKNRLHKAFAKSITNHGLRQAIRCERLLDKQQ